jgi:D-3-phosphoglycerate dehydrogenase / 2-oxoglutarate reductase
MIPQPMPSRHPFSSLHPLPYRAKAVRTDRELECPRIDSGLRAAGVALRVLPGGITEDALIEAVRDADLLLMCYQPVSARTVEAATKLKGIVKFGVGIDAIDIDAARTRRIPVVNIPEYAEDTVAEGAFALMIALARKLMPLSREMAAKGWAWPMPRWLGIDLAGRTLGIVGCGKIGRSMARMASGFRMRVLGYDPNAETEQLRAAGIDKCDDLTEMLNRCDVVSIHAALKPETRHLIGARELAAMQPHALFINSARGALVDEDALVKALQGKRIGGAALDVFSREPLTLHDHPMSALFAMDNVILSPHLTFYTQEAMARLEEETLERCFEILDGRPVLVKSHDPRLRAQTHGVVFGP